MNAVSSCKSKKIAVCAKGLPPCNNICPVGENIQAWISLANKKRFREAWEVVTASNPFPAVHGRVCYSYCENRCNRIQYDATVSVHCIERFLGDLALAEKWSFPAVTAETKKKVLIVGAGPAGLSAAYHLRRKGHDVTIYEAFPKPGGTTLVGIPAYRLPKEILFGEIERLKKIGVKIICNRRVEDVIKEKKHGAFDAVFLAIGAHLGKSLAIQLENNCLVIDAIDYLRGVALGSIHDIGSRLAVYGGGNTAIDVARTAKRLGVADVSVIYHRTREKMSAFSGEIADALSEGVKFIYLRTITSLNRTTLTMSINELDQKGRSVSIGKTETMDVDALVFALNQNPDSEFLRKIPEIEIQPNGVISIDNFFMTGYPGIFAGGDVTPYERSVTIAVGHGKRAASHINAYLHDTVFSEPPFSELIQTDRLHINSAKSTKTKERLLDPEVRLKSFTEVLQGNTESDIIYESERCFSCGNCLGCGKCYAVCPVKVISHSEIDGIVTEINTERCIGCGKCVKVCPCGAMSLIERRSS